MYTSYPAGSWTKTTLGSPIGCHLVGIYPAVTPENESLTGLLKQMSQRDNLTGRQFDVQIAAELRHDAQRPAGESGIRAVPQDLRMLQTFDGDGHVSLRDRLRRGRLAR